LGYLIGTSASAHFRAPYPSRLRFRFTRCLAVILGETVSLFWLPLARMRSWLVRDATIAYFVLVRGRPILSLHGNHERLTSYQSPFRYIVSKRKRQNYRSSFLLLGPSFKLQRWIPLCYPRSRAAPRIPIFITAVSEKTDNEALNKVHIR